MQRLMKQDQRILNIPLNEIDRSKGQWLGEEIERSRCCELESRAQET